MIVNWSNALGWPIYFYYFVVCCSSLYPWTLSLFIATHETIINNRWVNNFANKVNSLVSEKEYNRKMSMYWLTGLMKRSVTTGTVICKSRVYKICWMKDPDYLVYKISGYRSEKPIFKLKFKYLLMEPVNTK